MTTKPFVAPRAGAWIETAKMSRAHRFGSSRPVRARGLKPTEAFALAKESSRAPCGRVD